LGEKISVSATQSDDETRSKLPERAYGDRPEFAVDEIKLDESKVLIHWVTQ
jgi:hypothetical protein